MERKCRDSAQFHLLRAKCHSSLGDLEACALALREAHRIDPDLRMQSLSDPAFEAIYGAEPHIETILTWPFIVPLSAKDLPAIIPVMPTTSQLRKAVIISEKLDELQAELAAILGGSSAPAKAAKEPKAPKAKKTKRTMSPEAREKIAAAQRKRWAKQKKAAPKA